MSPYVLTDYGPEPQVKINTSYVAFVKGLFVCLFALSQQQRNNQPAAHILGPHTTYTLTTNATDSDVAVAPPSGLIMAGRPQRSGKHIPFMSILAHKGCSRNTP